MRHLWIIGDSAADRRTAINAELFLDCHRLHRGPFTGAGGVLAELVPRIHLRWPELVHKHRFAILTAAPQLENFTGDVPKTLHMTASTEERTRYQGGLARRASHGITELLAEYAGRGEAPLRLAFDAVHAADHTDQEFLAILLRRMDPSLVQVQIGTTATSLPAELATALSEYATPLTATPAEASAPRSEDALVRAYVASDGTSDDPGELAAWSRAEPDRRAALHDAAADALAGGDGFGARLGAIPYHREHGSDPAGSGAGALEFAVQHCAGQGFFAATIELAHRALALVTPDRQREYCQLQAALALSMRDTDPAQAERILNDLRCRYPLPQIHRSTSYSLAMLHTAFHAEKNHPLAKAYAQNAIAIAGTTPDPQERAFHLSFHRNGLALIELRLGNPAEALRLVTSAIEILAEELPDDRYRQHHSVLFHNRARVYQALGRFDEAKRDFDTAIARDPYFPEFHYDRGNLARLQGDDDAALADYEDAMRLSAPVPETYYSRGDVRATQGDVIGALADFGHVLELEPGHLDARINRAALLLDVEDLEGAAADVARGLAIEPGDPHLLCIRGQIALERGDHELARADFADALTADPALHAALVNSAVLDYEEHDFDTAAEKLTRALELAGEDPDLWYNRGLAHQAAGRRDAAAEDYATALGLPGADRGELLHQLQLCRAEPAT